MTDIQIKEAKAVTQALTPSEVEDGASCSGPASLILRFEEFVRASDISMEVFLGLEVPDQIRWAEAVLQVDRSKHLSLAQEFADHLATSPEENIPGYWGGSLPAPRTGNL